MERVLLIELAMLVGEDFSCVTSLQALVTRISRDRNTVCTSGLVSCDERFAEDGTRPASRHLLSHRDSRWLVQSPVVRRSTAASPAKPKGDSADSVRGMGGTGDADPSNTLRSLATQCAGKALWTTARTAAPWKARPPGDARQTNTPQTENSRRSPTFAASSRGTLPPRKIEVSSTVRSSVAICPTYDPRVSRERLELALSKIPPAAWEDFEQFASEFLIADFPHLRTMARLAGDAGRDADIFDVAPAGGIKLQYSVTVGWRSKILSTVYRLKDFKPKPTHLIYVTNQQIGPEADDLKRDILAGHNILLDVRDRSYFLDRRDHTIAARAASEVIEGKFVAPLLTSHGIAHSIAPALTAEEERIAFLHISIDLIGRDRSRNFSKDAYEALVLAVLHGTTHETALRRDSIHDRICSFVHADSRHQLDARIDSALDRLSKKRGTVKHIRPTDCFHIAFEEATRINSESEKFLEQENAFEEDILAALYIEDSELAENEQKGKQSVRALREVIEKLLLDYGEQFTTAIATGNAPEATKGKLEHLLTEMSFKTHLSNAAAAEIINMVLTQGTDKTAAHLRRLLDSYTVLAMLKSTPDVQKALRKVFSGGQIWLDTSVILPLMAEELYSDRRPIHDLVRACRLSETKLFVTTGVIEEVNSHLNRCVSTARSGGSSSYRLSFLLREYIANGNPRSGFTQWQENFRGPESPLLDIEEYLRDEFGIVRQDLQDEVDTASQELRIAAQDYWREEQQKRRGESGIDSASLDRLVAHDVENSVGVIQLRGRSNPGPTGYQHWWLTTDRLAKGLSTALESALGDRVATPVIDPGFLVQLLRFRPHSPEEASAALGRFPVLLGLARMDVIPCDMIDVVEEIRSEIPTLKPRLIRRRLRDEINKRKSGEHAEPNDDGPGIVDDIGY